jgi:hypothetical protein
MGQRCARTAARLAASQRKGCSGRTRHDRRQSKVLFSVETNIVVDVTKKVDEEFCSAGEQEEDAVSSRHKADNGCIPAGPGLKVVSTMSAGYDHVQLPALSSRGVRLGISPFSPFLHFAIYVDPDLPFHLKRPMFLQMQWLKSLCF